MENKRVGIVINELKDKNGEFSQNIKKWLEEKGCAVNEKNPFKDTDFTVVLGGDGTILEVAEKSALSNIPVIGINLGNLGYLTDAERGDCYTALQNVLNNEYKIEKRMTLEACMSADKDGKKILALNEFCVSKGVLSKIMIFEVYINNCYINSFKADGIIVSTPTGSTAYNLSAGGPILKPDSSMTAITPICPHDLFARPFVVPGDDRVCVKIVSEGKGILLTDGRVTTQLEEGDSVSITKSNHFVSVIKTGGNSFYEVLRKKMGREK